MLWPCAMGGGQHDEMVTQAYGRDYAAHAPSFVGLQDAAALIRSAFSPLERASFRVLGIRQVLVLHATERTQ